MLLYLVKHSQPDLCNETQELSKVMDKATEGHMKDLCRVIKYALDTQNIGLKLKPEDATTMGIKGIFRCRLCR